MITKCLLRNFLVSNPISTRPNPQCIYPTHALPIRKNQSTFWVIDNLEICVQSKGSNQPDPAVCLSLPTEGRFCLEVTHQDNIVWGGTSVVSNSTPLEELNQVGNIGRGRIITCDNQLLFLVDGCMHCNHVMALQDCNEWESGCLPKANSIFHRSKVWLQKQRKLCT